MNEQLLLVIDTTLDQNKSITVWGYYTPAFIDSDAMKKIRNMKRRGISDIIAVLLLLGITVAGAVLVSAFFQGNNILRFDSSSQTTQTSYLTITGYDTRDGLDLSGISVLDNLVTFPYVSTPSLCTSSCSTFPNALPTDASHGTEYIVLDVRNEGINTATLQTVEINGIEHSWNSSSTSLDLLSNPKIGAGKFVIIEKTNSSPQNKRTTNFIAKNDEVRLVIKLSKDIPGNINATQPINTRLITNLIDPNTIVITGGTVR